MNMTVKTFNVRDHIAGIVIHVCDTMLTLPATVSTPGKLPNERVSGAIGMAGEHVVGTIYIHLPETLARDVTRAMLQCTPGQHATDSDVNDVLGELSNMIGCRLKSLLNDADVDCAVSTPSVIRGAFDVEAPQGITAEMFYFTCLGQRFAVEVHLQILEANLESI
jgi:CheY-specific phosphatase CheX